MFSNPAPWTFSPVMPIIKERTKRLLQWGPSLYLEGCPRESSRGLRCESRLIYLPAEVGGAQVRGPGPRWGPVTHRHLCARRQGSCDLSKVIESVCQPVKCPVIFPCRHNFIGIMECLGFRLDRNSDADADVATGREILGILNWVIKTLMFLAILKNI